MNTDPTRAEQPPATYAELYNFLTTTAAQFGAHNFNEDNQLMWRNAQAGSQVTVYPTQAHDNTDRLAVEIRDPSSVWREMAREGYPGDMPGRPHILKFIINPQPEDPERAAWLLITTQTTITNSRSNFSYDELLALFQGMGTEINKPRNLWRGVVGRLVFEAKSVLNAQTPFPRHP